MFVLLLDSVSVDGDVAMMMVTLPMTTLLTMMGTRAVTVLVRRADCADDGNSDGNGDSDSGDDTRGAPRR